jgi:hypothetical protein
LVTVMTKVKGNNMRKYLGLALVTVFVNGCSHLQSVSTTSVPAQRGNKVTAERERSIFLLFNFNNDYVNDMAQDLAEKCQGGKIQGLLTKQENIVYFPLIFHKIRVTAEGYCVGGRGA